jgi:hypothetical protein
MRAVAYFGVVVSDSQTHEFSHVGHGAIEEHEVTDGELLGGGPM